MEQLNIEGKRSGKGFVAHKSVLVSALARALGARVNLIDITIGRKGFLNYLKSLMGNVVKVTPCGDDSGKHITNKIKVVCGNHTSQIATDAWVKEPSKGGKGGTPLTFCEVRVMPRYSIIPNIGSLELAEALNRVLPFTAKDDKNRPVLSCVKFVAKEGKLSLVSADGFRLAIISLDYEGEGEALVRRDDLQMIANALRKAKRARISFEAEDVSKPSTLKLETELIGYQWTSVAGSYPEYQKLVPSEFNTFAHFDTVEAIKAVRTLKALSGGKAYPIDITLDGNTLTMANPDVESQSAIPADVEGNSIKVRIDGKYLADILKACGGMVDLKVVNAYTAMLFSQDGYQVVTMPMITDEAREAQKRDYEAKQPKATPQAEAPVVAEAEAVAKATAEAKPKRKHKAKVPAAVA